ncbi:hypothetical protein HZA73_09385 [candidate division TA06 bacterium]|nr:hypothetical protein [candidate division TA06 bacterium]
MPNDEDIEKEIEKRIKNANVVSHGVWNIGVTGSPRLCKKFHNYPAHFMYWKAGDPVIALKIKEHFLQKGMKEAIGQDDAKADYVFIY